MSAYTKLLRARVREIFPLLADDITVRDTVRIAAKNTTRVNYQETAAVAAVLYEKYQKGELVRVGRLKRGRANIYRKPVSDTKAE